MRTFIKGIKRSGGRSVEVELPQSAEWSSKHISSAKLLDLHNTPVELLPAPGGRFYYVVHGFVFHYRFVTTPYSYNSSELATSCMVMWKNTLPGYEGAYFLPLHFNSGSMKPSDLFKKTHDLYAIDGVDGNNLVSYAWTPEDIEDQPLQLAIDPVIMPDGLEGGDGTLTVRLFYSLRDGAS